MIKMLWRDPEGVMGAVVLACLVAIVLIVPPVAIGYSAYSALKDAWPVAHQRQPTSVLPPPRGGELIPAAEYVTIMSPVDVDIEGKAVRVVPRIEVPTGRQVMLKVRPPLYDGQDPFTNGFDIEPGQIAP